MKRLFSYLLPVLGAAGFAVFSELSLRRPDGEFLLWSLAVMAWILLVFFVLTFGRLRKRLMWLAVPATMMIAFSTAISLLFLDLVSPRRGFIAFFAVVLYLFFEHVRRETAAPDQEERLTIAEFARMVNIGSMFLIASVGVGVTVFLPVASWWTIVPLGGVAILWSWHLYAACSERCGRPLSRVLITALLVLETYLVVLRLPTPMFVGGGLGAVVYYLAANLLPVGAKDAIPAKLIRRYAIVGVGMIALLLATARWI